MPWQSEKHIYRGRLPGEGNDPDSNPKPQFSMRSLHLGDGGCNLDSKLISEIHRPISLRQPLAEVGNRK